MAAASQSMPGTGHRIWTGIRAHAMAFFREPLYLVLLVALPVIEIWFAGSALDSLPAAAFPAIEASLVTTGRLFGAIFATAVFAGVVGLFQRLSADETDRRLLIAGSSPGRLFLTRFLTILGITAVVAAVSAVALAAFEQVARPGLTFGILLGAGILYAAFGMLVGSLLSGELEGSLALVFLVDIDVVLASGLLPTDLVLGELFPLYHPYQLLEVAVLGGTFGADHLLPSLGYLVVASGTAALIYARTAGINGGET